MSSDLEYFEDMPLGQTEKVYYNPDAYNALNQMVEEIESYDNTLMNQMYSKTRQLQKLVGKLEAETPIETLQQPMIPPIVQSQQTSSIPSPTTPTSFSFVCPKPPPIGASYITAVQLTPNSWQWSVTNEIDYAKAKALCGDIVITDPQPPSPPLETQNDCSVITNQNAACCEAITNRPTSPEACTCLCDPLSPLYNPTKCEIHGCGNGVIIDRRPPGECPPCEPIIIKPECPPNIKDECCKVINNVSCPPPTIVNKIEPKNITIETDDIKLNCPPPIINLSPIINVSSPTVKNEIIIKSPSLTEDGEPCEEEEEQDEEEKKCKPRVQTNHLEWFVSKIGQKTLEKYASEFGFPTNMFEASTQMEGLKKFAELRKATLRGRPEKAMYRR